MNKKEFLTSLKCRKIDINKSVHFLHEFDLADRYGTKYRFSTSEELLEQLKELGCDVEGVYYKKPDWFISNDTSESEVDTEEEVVERSTVETPEIDSESVVEETDTIAQDEVEIVSEQPIEAPVVTEEESSEVSNTTNVDWEWINSLKSTRDDKKRLDKYTQDNFDINLNQGQKISKMIEEFKTALEEK